MIQILIAYFIYSLSRFFSGLEDGDVSITEIELARSDRTKEQREKDTARRNRWHRNGGIKLALAVVAIAILPYGFTFPSVLLIISLLNLQVLIFNPVIATKFLKQGFFYLSPNGWEGIFNKIPKIYYFANLISLIACIYFQLI